jgi:DNA-binding HxlR family transcriptional regulator
MRSSNFELGAGSSVWSDAGVRNYGQYCPLAKAAEIIGDRWTPLIVRELLAGVHRFSDLERGLPGISRSVLTQRLRALERARVVDRRAGAGGRTTRYELTTAGRELQPVVDVLGAWGAQWAFHEPGPDELDGGLLMGWISRRIDRDRLPSRRVVVRFDFTNVRRVQRFWLLLARTDVAMCLENPGFEEDLVVSARLDDFYQVWAGRIPYQDAVRGDLIRLTGTPAVTRAFPTWLQWSRMAAAVRAGLTQDMTGNDPAARSAV